jgi:hypothetical protein
MRMGLTFVLCLWAAASPALASDQPNAGSIEGTVVDRYTGQAIFAADVVVVGARLGGIADRDGRFSIAGVPAGEWRVEVSMMGYEPEAMSEVVVPPGGSATVGFELAPKLLDIGLKVLVEAGHFPRDSEKPTSSRTLTPQEMRQAPGAMEDVFRVLQAMPGVSSAGTQTTNIVVRGGCPEENRTLLENIEIRSPLHFGRPGGMAGGISIVNPGLLERADFLTGGFPARYGDRLSSVFEMKLKDGNRTRFNTDVSANLSGFSLAMDGPLPGGGSMVYSVRRGVFDLLTTAMGVAAYPSYWDVVGKVTYDLGPSNRLSLVGFYYPDDLRIDASHEEDAFGEWPEFDLERDDYGSALGLNWRYLLDGRGHILTTAAYVANAWTTGRGTDDAPALVGDDIREDEAHLKTELSYKLSDRVDLRTGLSLQRIWSDHTTWSIADTTVAGRVVPAYGITYTPPPTYKAGSYVQTTLRNAARLSVTAGLRFDNYGLTGESKLSPRLGASFVLTDRTSLNAAYGHYYQTAAPHQVAAHPLNAALRSSRSTHYIAGFEHLLSEDTRLTVEAYHKDLDDVFVESRTRRVITNDGSGYARGVELCVQKRMSGKLVGSLAYTYSVSKRKDDDHLPEYYSEFDRPHNLTVVGSYRLSDEWRIGAQFHYATGSPYTPVIGAVEEDGEWRPVRAARNSARFPDYHVLDVRIDRTFHFKDWTLTAYLDLWNAYGRGNVTWYGYMIGEDGDVTRVTTDEGMSEALPILGLKASF